MPKRKAKFVFKDPVKYRHVDGTVWNHNTMPLPVTLESLESKNIVRHLNVTNNKRINNLHYKKLLHFQKIITFKNVLNNFRLFLRYIN